MMSTRKARLRPLGHLGAAAAGLLGLAALPAAAHAETHFATRIAHVDHEGVVQCVVKAVRAYRQEGFKVLGEKATPGLDGIAVGVLSPAFKSSLACTQGVGGVFLVLTVAGPDLVQDEKLAEGVLAAAVGGQPAAASPAASQ